MSAFPPLTYIPAVDLGGGDILTENWPYQAKRVNSLCLNMGGTYV